MHRGARGLAHPVRRRQGRVRNEVGLVPGRRVLRPELLPRRGTVGVRGVRRRRGRSCGPVDDAVSIGGPVVAGRVVRRVRRLLEHRSRRQGGLRRLLARAREDCEGPAAQRRALLARGRRQGRDGRASARRAPPVRLRRHQRGPRVRGRPGRLRAGRHRVRLGARGVEARQGLGGRADGAEQHAEPWPRRPSRGHARVER